MTPSSNLDLSEQILTEEGAESYEYIDAVSNDILKIVESGKDRGAARKVGVSAARQTQIQL